MLPLASGKVSKDLKTNFYIIIYMWYHLRVSVDDKEKAKDVIDLYLGNFPVNAYVFGYEEKDDNHHFHGHIKYDDDYDPTVPKNKVKRSEFFKKLKSKGIVPDKTESNYHEVCKDEKKNLAYVIKDCDIIGPIFNIDEDDIEEARQTVERIEAEKKTPMKDQLLNLWLPKQRIFMTRLEAFIFIDQYHIDRNYLPPNMTNKIQYALYIIYKYHSINNYELNEESYKLIGSFMNIHEKEAETSYNTTNFITVSYDEKVKQSPSVVPSVVNIRC